MENSNNLDRLFTFGDELTMHIVFVQNMIKCCFTGYNKKIMQIFAAKKYHQTKICDSRGVVMVTGLRHLGGGVIPLPRMFVSRPYNNREWGERGGVVCYVM